MVLAGVPVRDEHVEQLAAILGRDREHRTAERLRRSLVDGCVECLLDENEREAIFNALQECPDDDGLLELRVVLLHEHEARLRSL